VRDARPENGPEAARKRVVSSGAATIASARTILDIRWE